MSQPRWRVSSGRSPSTPRASPECSTPGLGRSHKGGTPPFAPPLVPPPQPKQIDTHLIYVTLASALRAGCETRPRPSARHWLPGNRAVRARGDACADGGGCWEMVAVTSVVEMCHHVMFPWAGPHGQPAGRLAGCTEASAETKRKQVAMFYSV